MAQQQVVESFYAFQSEKSIDSEGVANQRPETEPGNPTRLTRRGREQASFTVDKSVRCILFLFF